MAECQLHISDVNHAFEHRKWPCTLKSGLYADGVERRTWRTICTHLSDIIRLRRLLKALRLPVNSTPYGRPKNLSYTLAVLHTGTAPLFPFGPKQTSSKLYGVSSGTKTWLIDMRCDIVQVKELQPMPIALSVDAMMVYLTCVGAAHIQG